MGYTTDFAGQLNFTRELTAKELSIVKSFLGKSVSDHPDWEKKTDTRLGYIDLEITSSFDGVEWDGSEKTYDMEELVNVLILNVRKQIPDFGLTGQLNAQGEEVGDVWVLKIDDDGFAVKVETPPDGEKICCPHCDEYFYYKKED